MATRCENCRYWQELRYEDLKYERGLDKALRWGHCKMIGEQDIESAEAPFLSERAYTAHASGYRSWLTTRSDFGCVEFAPTPEEET